MRIHLTADQHAFFRKNRFLELEEVISAEIAEAASKAIDRQLKADGLERSTPTSIYLKEHDLWRKEEAVKRISCHRPLAELAADLCGVRSLRVAYDQLIRTGLSEAEVPPLANTELNAFSSIQQIEAAVMIRLSSGGEERTNGGNHWLPRRCGSVVAFDPKVSLPFVDLYRTPCVNYLLVTYAGLRALYVLNPNDVHTHGLKALGYVFGDRLREDTHPTLVRP